MKRESFLMILLASLVRSKVDDWYIECQGGEECGFTRNRSNGDCQDLNPDCRTFALLGECQVNPAWMHSNCQRSCGICVTELHEDEHCEDMHSSCPMWASELECFLNPGFLSRACRKSCWLCVNATDLRQDGVSEENIQRRIQFSQMDFGQWQSIPETNPEQVRRVVSEMAIHAMTLEKMGPGTVCNNVEHGCALMVAERGNCEADLDLMLPRCSLACQMCDVVEEYHACRAAKRNVTPLPFGDLADIQTYLSGVKHASNLLEDFPETLEEGEWIFSLKYSDLWETGTKEIVRDLLDILKSDANVLKWVEADKITDSPLQKRSGRVAFCDHSCQTLEPRIRNLTEDISKLLQVGSEYLQPLEFVHYTRGERFKAHHAFRTHDSWRHSGHRALTVFIALENPHSGGSIGFPEYNWLQVKRPQVLVWPNITPQSPTRKLQRMMSEQLPVVDGEMYGVYATLRQFPHDSGSPCA